MTAELVFAGSAAQSYKSAVIPAVICIPIDSSSSFRFGHTDPTLRRDLIHTGHQFLFQTDLIKGNGTINASTRRGDLWSPVRFVKPFIGGRPQVAPTGLS